MVTGATLGEKVLQLITVKFAIPEKRLLLPPSHDQLRKAPESRRTAHLTARI